MFPCARGRRLSPSLTDLLRLHHFLHEDKIAATEEVPQYLSGRASFFVCTDMAQYLSDSHTTCVLPHFGGWALSVSKSCLCGGTLVLESMLVVYQSSGSPCTPRKLVHCTGNTAVACCRVQMHQYQPATKHLHLKLPRPRAVCLSRLT